MIQIAICDDDKEDQKKYKAWVLQVMARTDRSVEVTCYDSGRALLFQLEDVRNHPDILLMDIHMPDENGMDLSRVLRDKTKDVNYKGELIFLTKSCEYAIDAFDVNAFHYVVKDVTLQEKFDDILIRAAEKCASKKKKQLLLRGNGEYRNIDVNTIYYFEIYRRIITVHYGDPEETFEFYSSMAKLEEVVLPFGFLRSYKSVIVRVGAIISLSKTEATLENGDTIPVSGTYYSNLKIAFESKKQI